MEWSKQIICAAFTVVLAFESQPKIDLWLIILWISPDIEFFSCCLRNLLPDNTCSASSTGRCLISIHYYFGCSASTTHNEHNWWLGVLRERQKWNSNAFNVMKTKWTMTMAETEPVKGFKASNDSCFTEFRSLLFLLLSCRLGYECIIHGNCLINPVNAALVHQRRFLRTRSSCIANKFPQFFTAFL